MLVIHWHSWFLRCPFSCGFPVVIRQVASRFPAGFCRVLCFCRVVFCQCSHVLRDLSGVSFRAFSSSVVFLFSSRLVFQALRPSRRKISRAVLDSLSS